MMHYNIDYGKNIPILDKKIFCINIILHTNLITD